jgi:hypothetical protein
MPLGNSTVTQLPVGAPKPEGTSKVDEPTTVPCIPLTPAIPLEIMFAVIDVGVGLEDHR